MTATAKAWRSGCFLMISCAVGWMTTQGTGQAEPAGRKPLASMPEPELEPTLSSVAETTWIYARPERNDHPVGYIRPGQSLPLLQRKLVRGSGCPGGFVEVAPFGYVCLDRTTSFDRASRWARSLELLQPRAGLLPFDYALSNGAPMYVRLPTPEEWAREERYLGKAGSYRPQSWGNRGHEELAEARAIAPNGSLPDFLRGGGSAASESPSSLVRRQIPHGSLLSSVRAFEHAGRTWLLSADGTVVPADRVRPFRQSSFQGVKLTGKAELPLAFMRAAARPKYRRTNDGGFEPTGESWAVRTWVGLDAARQPVEWRGQRYLATQQEDAGEPRWIAESDATILTPEKRPAGALGQDKWLVISITRGTLVAYEGSTPVFATLVSPGAGGVPIPGRDLVKMSTTPMGTFRITFKHRADTMSPEIGDQRRFWIADVPFAQYFSHPFALHVTYWHERFGELMSAGCVNLSPRDGQYLFEWTDPPLPRGWAGVGPSALTGKGTRVIIRR